MNKNLWLLSHDPFPLPHKQLGRWWWGLSFSSISCQGIWHFTRKGRPPKYLISPSSKLQKLNSSHMWPWSWAIPSSIQLPLIQWRLYTSTAGWKNLGTDIPLHSLLRGGRFMLGKASQEQQSLPTLPNTLVIKQGCHSQRSDHCPHSHSRALTQKLCPGGEVIRKNRTVKLSQRKWLYLKWVVGKFKPKGTLENTGDFGG